MQLPKSWIPVAPTSDFSLQNVPFGVFSFSSSLSLSTRHCGTVLGETVISLSVLEEASLFRDLQPQLTPNTFYGETTLNKFIAHPKPVWSAVRKRLVDLLAEDGPDSRLKENQALRDAAFHKLDAVRLHLPIEISEYTDFYSSREHATNVGIMFRGEDNALQPNWLHLPVGYHGRASTVYVSGHSFPRPSGQLQLDPDDAAKGSTHAPCQALDFELEIGTVVGGPSPPPHHPVGQPMTIDRAKDRIFGFLLLNDWSARDIQKFEYVPLGPFTSKNFATTVSPWIVTSEALEPYRASTSAVTQTNPIPLAYLQDPKYSSYDVDLTVAIQSKDQTQPCTICRSNFRNLYWNSAQQLVHHSVTGCTMRPGDLLGSGTISGSTPDSFGSMLELSWKGTKQVQVGDETRKYLNDGDTVILRGTCGNNEEGVGRVGFGLCEATILPALDIVNNNTSTTVPNVEHPGSTATTADDDRYTSFKLYGYWRSSCTWRVRIALAAKSIDYQTISINLSEGEHQCPKYLEKNTLGQVPLLEFYDTETRQTLNLSQSSAIIDFLEDAFPNKCRLFPPDAYNKAVARQWMEVINSGTQPLQNQFFLMRIEQASQGNIKWLEEAKLANEKGLAALEILVQRRLNKEEETTNHGQGGGGPFCMGTFSPTIVDVYMVPQLANAKRFGVDLERICPTLFKVDQVCAQHPWFLNATPEVQPDAPL